MIQNLIGNPLRVDQGRKMLFLVTKTDKMDTFKGRGHCEDIGNIDLVDKSKPDKQKFVLPMQTIGNRHKIMIFPELSLLFLPAQMLYNGGRGESDIINYQLFTNKLQEIKQLG